MGPLLVSLLKPNKKNLVLLRDHQFHATWFELGLGYSLQKPTAVAVWLHQSTGSQEGRGKPCRALIKCANSWAPPIGNADSRSLGFRESVHFNKCPRRFKHSRQPDVLKVWSKTFRKKKKRHSAGEGLTKEWNSCLWSYLTYSDLLVRIYKIIDMCPSLVVSIYEQTLSALWASLALSRVYSLYSVLQFSQNRHLRGKGTIRKITVSRDTCLNPCHKEEKEWKRKRVLKGTRPGVHYPHNTSSENPAKKISIENMPFPCGSIWLKVQNQWQLQVHNPLTAIAKSKKL